MPFECRTAASGQQSEPIVQPRRDLFRRNDLDPGRREFDRQRDTVQTQADLRHGSGVPLRQLEPWIRSQCAIHEQSDAGVLGQSIQISWLARNRHGQWRYPERRFASDP
jgi:hypothetical protein